jgi:two-component system, OmpR family, phosphate regulon response regulator PhoB
MPDLFLKITQSTNSLLREIMTDSKKDGANILIIEDEMDMRFFLTTLIETSGLTPIVARNGREGLERARSAPPDLILLDVMMPEKGGALVYRQLRTDEVLRQIPVIILSAVSKAAFHHYLKMLNSEGDLDIPFPNAYIEKPPDPEYLQDTIGSLLMSIHDPALP